MTPGLYASTDLEYRDAKYQTTRDIYMCLTLDFGLKENWDHPDGYYSFRLIYGEWYVIAWKGCTWDGATMYPDYKWMLAPSLRHDLILYGIARGVISEVYNDVADLELRYAIINGEEPIPWFQGGNSKTVRRLHAYKIMRGTNLAYTRTNLGAPDVPRKKVKI